MPDQRTAKKTKPAKPAARPADTGLRIFYYGNGKGKTTAAMGLAARAAGAGMDVMVLQFVKAKRPAPGKRIAPGEWPVSNEILFFEAPRAAKNSGPKIGKIGSEQLGRGFVGILGDRKEREDHVRAAQQGLRRAAEVFANGKYGLVVLDELVSALEVGILTEREILALIKAKPKGLHIAYTGHKKYPKIIEASDLVSEIKMIKHPFYKGFLAQRGIDY